MSTFDRSQMKIWDVDPYTGRFPVSNSQARYEPYDYGLEKRHLEYRGQDNYWPDTPPVVHNYDHEAPRTSNFPRDGPFEGNPWQGNKSELPRDHGKMHDRLHSGDWNRPRPYYNKREGFQENEFNRNVKGQLPALDEPRTQTFPFREYDHGTVDHSYLDSSSRGLSTYDMQVQSKESPYAGRLEVNYSQAGDNRYDFECQERDLQHQGQDNHRPVAPPVVHYDNHEASSTCNIRKDSSFEENQNKKISEHCRDDGIKHDPVMTGNWNNGTTFQNKNASSAETVVQTNTNTSRKKKGSRWNDDPQDAMPTSQCNMPLNQSSPSMAVSDGLKMAATSSVNSSNFTSVLGEQTNGVVGSGNSNAKEPIHLKRGVLYPPVRDAPRPSTREKPPGCKTVFISGLPDHVTEQIIHEIFERCGPIKSVRLNRSRFCHVSFTDESSVENALQFSGYRLKIEDNDIATCSGTLHVDYSSSRDDIYEYECKKRALQRQARHQDKDNDKPGRPLVVTYSEHEVSQICESLKKEELFFRAAHTLIRWFERGECKKKTACTFFSMMQNTRKHAKTLEDAKVKCEAELIDAKKKLKKQLKKIISQLTEVGKVYKAASVKKCLNTFTKAQRKNIEIWKKLNEELKKAHEEALKEQEIEGIEALDDDDDDSKKNKDSDKLQNDSSKVSCGIEKQNDTQPTTVSSNLPGNNINSIVNVGDYCQYDVMPGQPNMIFSALKKVINLKNGVLYPPHPNAPHPSTRAKPPGCKTVFVGGLPEKATLEIIREIFERCGAVEKIKMFNVRYCHVRFTDEVFADNAIYFSGFKLKVENIGVPPYVGRLHVDYVHAQDDKYDYECKQQVLQKQSQDEPVTPLIIQYSDDEALHICEKLREEESFLEAACILISWLERGECTKKNSVLFFSMIQSTHNCIRKLEVDKVVHEEEVNEAKKTLQKQLERNVRHFSEIEKIYKAASLQKSWDHFTKAQRKYIELWKNQTEEQKNACMKEGINIRDEEEMELSDDDDDNDDSKKNTESEPVKNDSSEVIHKLKEEMISLRCQLEVLQNEITVMESYYEEVLKSKDSELLAVQQTLQNKNSELLGLQQVLQSKDSELLAVQQALQNSNGELSNLYQKFSKADADLNEHRRILNRMFSLTSS